jgi:hypothetical protein
MKPILWFLFGAVLSGCAPLLDSPVYEEPPPKPMEFGLDRVKLIAPEFTTENDPQTTEQPEYALSSTRRLLVRFSKMHDHTGLIRTNNGHKIRGRLVVLGDAGEAASALSICPMNRAFWLFATWDAAHHFDGQGRWHRPGGDFDEAGCVKGTADPDDAQALLFDLTRWFVDYPRGRRLYYGLIVTATKTTRIAGDLSGASFPKLLWEE